MHCQSRKHFQGCMITAQEATLDIALQSLLKGLNFHLPGVCAGHVSRISGASKRYFPGASWVSSDQPSCAILVVIALKY